MVKKLNIAVVSNSFPNNEQAHRGVYIKQTVDYLAAFARISIICPLPWFPTSKLFAKYKKWSVFGRIPYRYKFENWDVVSPKYPSIPKISAHLSTVLMLQGIFRAIFKQHREKKLDLLHAHNVFPDGVATVVVGKILRIPVVVSARGTDINEAAASGRLRCMQVCWALRNAHKVTAVSKALCKKIKELAPSIEPVSCISNGVDNDIFHLKNRAELREKHKISPDKKVILFVGAFRKVKGVEYLIDALSLLKINESFDFDMVLVGSGPLQQSYATAIKSNGLEGNVHFLGNLGHELVSEWLSVADVFCLPSLNEGMPNVVLEALSCGVPVVSTRVGGIPDVVTHVNGLLVPPGDPRKLADALSSVMRQSWEPEQIKESVADYTWESTAEKYYQVYRSALER